MASGVRKAGEFCWINILTPQPDAAREFFAGLLGWTYADMPGMGHLIVVDGHNVGGLFDLAAPQTPPGTPPQLGIMIRVDDADTTAARVIALGGKALPAFDVGPQGRMAVCHDPQGAAFDVWQPKAKDGMDVDGNVHGAPSWIECTTRDVAASRAFYGALFGWGFVENAMPGFTYTTFQLGGGNVAGLMPIVPQMGDHPVTWGVYFTVRDPDATAAQATQLGGSVCMPPMDIPNVGRFAGIVSPHGITFYVIRYDAR